MLTWQDMVIGMLVVTAFSLGLCIWSIVKDGQQPGRIGMMALPSAPPSALPVARQDRPLPPRAKWPWVLGIGWFVAAVAVLAWPEAASDCHGSPVCGLDGLAVLGKLIIAGVLAGVGAVWFLTVAIAQRGRR